MRKQNLNKKILSIILSLAITLPFGTVLPQNTNTKNLDTPPQENETKSIVLAENDIYIENYMYILINLHFYINSVLLY